MELKGQRTKQLLKKSITRKLTEDEVVELDALLFVLPLDVQEELYFQACEEVLKEEGRQLVQPFSSADKQRIMADIIDKNVGNGAVDNRGMYRQLTPYLVACFVFALALFAYFFFHAPAESLPSERLTAASSTARDLDPAAERAILTTEDGMSVVLDAIAKGNIVAGANFKIRRLGSGELLFQSINSSSNPKEHVIRTPKGGTISVILPDGTKVWLNAESSLTFNPDMHARDRQVVVEGEVYFEVAKRTKQRFIVKSRSSEIEVLGTKFNVNTYQRNQTEVGLLEGSIRLTTAKTKQRMKPSELAVIQADGYTKTTVVKDINDIVLWKEGLFIFRNASPDMLAREISRWYNIEVVVEDHNAKHQINGKISRDLKLSKMIEMLDYLGLHAIYKRNKLIINTKKTQPMS